MYDLSGRSSYFTIETSGFTQLIDDYDFYFSFLDPNAITIAVPSYTYLQYSSELTSYSYNMMASPALLTYIVGDPL